MTRSTPGSGLKYQALTEGGTVQGTQECRDQCVLFVPSTVFYLMPERIWPSVAWFNRLLITSGMEESTSALPPFSHTGVCQADGARNRAPGCGNGEGRGRGVQELTKLLSV